MPDQFFSDDQMGITPQAGLSDADMGLGEQPQPAAPKSYDWGDIPGAAAKNVLPSAGRFVRDIAQPIIHPIDTATNLKNLGLGALEKTGLTEGHEHEKYADAVGQFLVDRYGSIEAVKKTLAEDPVGIAADLSMIFTGGGAAAARAPGMIGKLGEAAAVAGRAIDPINAAGKVAAPLARLGGNAAAEIVGNFGTHTGADAIKTAYNSGLEGGEKAAAFQDNLRGNVSMEETVNEARSAVSNMRKQRGEAYRSEMKEIGADTTPLDFNRINDAFGDMNKIKTYKGQSLSPGTQKIREEMQAAVREWQMLDPKEFHTVEGLDALKQKIGSMRDSTLSGTPERTAANEVYHAIRKTIVDQSPEYAKTMKGYERASDLIKQVESELSLKSRESGGHIDTALRKLQSVLRNNVNTNYGRRKELAQYLVDNGAPNLMEKLAGQALNPWTARGLGKLGAQLGAEMALLGVGGFTLSPAAIAALPFMSPRATGELAYYGGRGAAKVGRLAPYVRPLAQASFQAGRLSRTSKQ